MTIQELGKTQEDSGQQSMGAILIRRFKYNSARKTPNNKAQR